MKRREFMTIIGGAAAWPGLARAQQPKMPVIGFLCAASSRSFAEFVVAFRQGLRETGYVEGQNVTVEYEWADGNYERLRTMADDFVRHQTTVIVSAGGIPAALAAKAATTSIPIVFFSGANPVEQGLVGSLNQPGGNLTGVTTLSMEVGAKRLELLHELVPTATKMALLVNPTTPTYAEAATKATQTAAHALGLQLDILHASTEHEIGAAFAILTERHIQALVIGGDNFFNSRSEQLAALALRHNVAAIYQYRAFAAAGGLLSYGGSITDAYRQIGIYTGRILRGEKAGDLPVQQSAKVELIINLITAKALGLTVPPSLLARAEEVME
ncbi:ABC transporter substrate-binding protein [Bradyrhizobium sp.]|uniref:ABC transporter substrate-binding protein n=1 Tax=Bradyrhizobium sp. TaxID=376 RepID=UPI003C792542